MADQLSPSNRSKDAAQKAAKGRISNARSLNRDPMEWAHEIHQGNRTALSQAITLTESANPPDQLMLDHLLQAIASFSAKEKSIRIGITGVPGVGKSTFIESYGQRLIDQGHRVAVLAVDPSSGISKGSLLGDKTRMELLAKESNAYIRPSPTSSALGGITRGTHEAILLCEAAGFDRILIETVGVGQSEVAVRECSDAFILLMLPGGGDELQGIKRGIMEMADVLLINKSDGKGIALARETAAQYMQALHLLPPNPAGHSVSVQLISALENQGILEFDEHLQALVKNWKSNASFEQRRNEQAVALFAKHVQYLSLDERWGNPEAKKLWSESVRALQEQRTNPYSAARNWIKQGS